MSKTVVALILDGWGIGQNNTANPIHAARPQTLESIKSHYPAGALDASGIAVGLPWGEPGNSKVGHLTIGAGRIVEQHFSRIMNAIKNGAFVTNKILTRVIRHAAKNKTALHLVGLISEGNEYASREHLDALIKLGKAEGCQTIRLHLFTDGEDSPPRSTRTLLLKIPFDNTVQLASLTGRWYAMNHEKNIERTQAVCAVLTGRGAVTNDYRAYIETSYEKNINDPFLAPTRIAVPHQSIQENDAVIFFNFRGRGIHEIRTALPQTTMIATMAEAFPDEPIMNTVGDVLAAHNKYQLRIAETERYQHITYFLNGMKDAPQKNEYRILIPARRTAKPDDHPEMMTREIGNRVIQAIEENIDCVLATIGAPDIIAHTGNFNAGIAAIRAVDEAIKAIVQTALLKKASVIITGSHGNIEQMRDAKTGMPETKHNRNPVPFYLIDANLERIKDARQIAESEEKTIGILADVAPTILHLMSIEQPHDMSGKSLIGKLI